MLNFQSFQDQLVGLAFERVRSGVWQFLEGVGWWNLAAVAGGVIVAFFLVARVATKLVRLGPVPTLAAVAGVVIAVAMLWPGDKGAVATLAGTGPKAERSRQRASGEYAMMQSPLAGLSASAGGPVLPLHASAVAVPPVSLHGSPNATAHHVASQPVHHQAGHNTHHVVTHGGIVPATSKPATHSTASVSHPASSLPPAPGKPAHPATTTVHHQPTVNPAPAPSLRTPPPPPTRHDSDSRRLVTAPPPPVPTRVTSHVPNPRPLGTTPPPPRVGAGAPASPPPGLTHTPPPAHVTANPPQYAAWVPQPTPDQEEIHRAAKELSQLMQGWSGSEEPTPRERARSARAAAIRSYNRAELRSAQQQFRTGTGAFAPIHPGGFGGGHMGGHMGGHAGAAHHSGHHR